MNVVPLGRITVTSAGTPVRATATATPCFAVIFTPVAGNAGATHVGISTLVKSTGVGVIKTLLKPGATGVSDELRITAPEGNLLNAADYYVDADTSADAVLVSYITV